MRITQTGQNTFGGIWSITEKGTLLGSVVTWRHQYVPVSQDGTGSLPFCGTRTEAAARLMK